MITRRFAIIIYVRLTRPGRLVAEIIDYHQHLYGPEATARTPLGRKGIDASSLIAELDAAGIQRVIVFSAAYSLANPNKPAVPNEYQHVKRRTIEPVRKLRSTRKDSSDFAA